jgi:large subunit ribosomal protein L24
MKFSSPLSADLREKYKRKALRPRKGDSVRIVRGEFLGVEGKITKVFPKDGRLSVEGVSREKIKGGTAPVPIESSKVIITSLNLDDKIRKAKLEVQS